MDTYSATPPAPPASQNRLPPSPLPLHNSAPCHSPQNHYPASPPARDGTPSAHSYETSSHTHYSARESQPKTTSKTSAQYRPAASNSPRTQPQETRPPSP